MKIVNNMEEFNKILSQGKVIVEFYADWCGPCRMLAPHFNEASKQATEVIFIKVNVDEAEDIAKKYDILSIPTIIYFDQGEIKNRIQGFVKVETILKLIK